MNVKDKVDIIAKQADIIYKKNFIFSAIAGGSWIYGIKTNGYLGVIIWIVFVLAVVGLVINLTKQGTLYLELEEIKMENLEWLYGMGLIGAIVIGYIAVKKHWKIADIF